jgi:hypothetical protein
MNLTEDEKEFLKKYMAKACAAYEAQCAIDNSEEFQELERLYLEGFRAPFNQWDFDDLHVRMTELVDEKFDVSKLLEARNEMIELSVEREMDLALSSKDHLAVLESYYKSDFSKMSLDELRSEVLDRQENDICYYCQSECTEDDEPCDERKEDRLGLYKFN